MTKIELEKEINSLLIELETADLAEFGYVRSKNFILNMTRPANYTSFQINLINYFFKAYCLSDIFENKHYNSFQSIDKETKRKIMLDSYFKINV